MKKIFRIKSLLLLVMIMILFSTKIIVSGDGEKTSPYRSKANKRKRNNGEKRGNGTRKGLSQKSKKRTTKKSKKKRKQPKSVISLFNMNEEIYAEVLEKAAEKATMSFNPEVVYQEGNRFIANEEGDSVDDDAKAVQIGDYRLAIPENLDKQDADEIISKMKYLLPLAVMAGSSEQFNLGAIALLKNDTDYMAQKENNSTLVKEEIEKSQLHKLMAVEGVIEFINRAIILELKAVLKAPSETSKESFFKRWFKGSSPVEEVKKIAKNNPVLNKIDFLGELSKSFDRTSGLDEKTIYLVAATGYYIKNQKESFLKSKFFEDMMHAITIPLNAKIIDKEGQINNDVHKDLLEMYNKVLKLYNIRVKGIKKSKNAKFVIESTLYSSLLKWSAIGVAGLAAAAFATQVGHKHYHRENKNRSLWDTTREVAGVDYEYGKSIANKGFSKVKKAYNDIADNVERNVLKEEGRYAIAEAAAEAALEGLKVKKAYNDIADNVERNVLKEEERNVLKEEERYAIAEAAVEGLKTKTGALVKAFNENAESAKKYLNNVKEEVSNKLKAGLNRPAKQTAEEAMQNQSLFA